jgi:ATPase subunit of ABC transporter with duplicated ATPase domains
MRSLLEMSAVSIRAPGGRPLFEGLSLSLSRERVALIGRNGVGKSTLLAAMAGVTEPAQGRVVTRGTSHYLPQAVIDPGSTPDRSLSHGERQKLALSRAQASGAELLLLDEPSDHLDEAAVAWLRSWLGQWPGCAVVASHDRRLLHDFRHFFIASESGCRYFWGTLEELDLELEREHHETEREYARNLQRLATQEEHTDYVARRKARKKRAGRCAELDRATSRMQLNQKRSFAQVSHGRLAKLREQRLASLRQWSQATRRALGVNLSLELAVPTLPAAISEDIIVLRQVAAQIGQRTLFQALDLRLGRARVALTGANGAGKTTLLEIMLGQRAPSAGSASRELGKLGSIEQGGSNWLLDDSLLSRLGAELAEAGAEGVARLLVAHKFPLARAERPLRSLSPGERARAALICLFHRSPALELLVLDEPTFSLDLVGQRALTDALRAWPGGLVVASHDRAFLQHVGIDTWLELGG